MAVKLNLNDIQFILDQIKIAEAHASGTPLDQLVDSPLLPLGLRTVDGSYNNFGVGREQWGASGEPFPGLAEPNYPTGSGSFATPGYPTNNDYGQAGSVVDGEPRLISNLIVDQTSTNPAAIYAALQYAGHEGDMFAAVRDIRAKFDEIRSIPDWEKDLALQDEYQEFLNDYGVELDGWTIMLPNEAPDDGISASYNSLLTFFGQFFDHGLDLVKKGGNGTVYIPLSPDDPLYVAGSHTNFMAVTRATTDEAAAGNVTTPWVDQNQTYTSNASHQIFLREYEDGPDGKPVTTGHLLDGARGLATWADVKAQSYNLLGIDLTDLDVTSVPEMLVDPYGEFIRGDNGLPQILAAFVKKADADGNTYFDPIYVEGDRANPVDPSAIQLPPGTLVYDPSTGFNRAVADGETVSAARTGHAFLDDIAHTAAPVKDANGQLVADADSDAGNQVAMDMMGRNTEYDDELLDAHYITGDGRGNENIGLSAVHHIFHSEHNRQVEDIKATIEASGNPDLIAQWKLEDGSWDGERLFQAARFATEMQYQHLAFEEFARKIQPDVDIFMVQPDVELNPAILSEFAHVVYRFGHSMLNETVDMIDANGDRSGSMDLFDAFLNPLAFGAEDVSHAEAAGAIIRGMTGQVGNEIDEFVTNTLRNQLLGIPLDLAAINIARGRDTGMPSLNEARAQFMEMADGDTQLKPYESWSDFGLNLKNPASIINFIAAYGTHETITSATTIDDKRDAALALVMGGEGAPADRMDFLEGTGAYAGDPDLGGLQNVDLWVGGLAEKKMSFGGMLGSTFSFVFEMQMEQLQDADRFYYLSRVQGRNLLTELENNSLAKMALANTDLGETDFAIPSDIFSAPDHIFYMDHAKQLAMTGKDDPEHEDQALSGFTKLVVRRDSAPVDVEASGLPAGVTFDADARSLAGTVSDAGSYDVTLTSIYENDLTQDHVVQIVAAEATPVDAGTMDALVDDAYYNEANPDVAAAGMDPDDHFAQFGWSEGRSPSAFFDIAFYVAQMPDKDWNGINPLVHYAEIGWKLGLDPAANFDTGAYLAAHPDVAAAGMNPLAHYLQFGRDENRAIFDAAPSDTIPVEVGQVFSVDLPQSIFAADGIAEYLRYNGADHIAVGGSDGDDVIIAGDGDDTVWGFDGDDRIEAGYGVDLINGGKGDDIITNAGTDIGETDMFKGDEGNDVIHAGSGLALLFGGEGKDFLMTGPDGAEARGGEGDDFLLGGEGQDALFGNGGDDWLEGRARFDFIAGDNADIFFNSDIIGHDVLNGGRGDSDYDADSGDDIMVAGEGIEKNIGMWGHDWVIHKGQKVGADADMNFPVFPTLPLEVLRDRFSEVEGLSGWKHDDILRGDDRVADDSFELESEVEEERPVNEPGEEEDGVVQEEVIIPGVTVVTQKQEVAPAVYDPTPEGNFVHNELDQDGIDRIAGLDKIITPDMMRAQEYRANGSWENLAEGEQGDIKEVFVGGNILLGGGGSDLIEGRGGDDVIDGDAWLNVRISIRDENGVEIATADGMNARVYSADGAELHRGRPLSALMLERVYNPGQLHIAREILYDDSGTDRAHYWDDQDNYAFDGTSDGRLVVEHVIATEGDAVDGNAGDPFDPITGQNRTSDGRDILSNIEELQFRDGVVGIINGTSANNTMDGTGGNNIILGLDGNDTINAGQGNDLLIGGRGNDQLFGGADDDRLIGGSGNDTLQGGTGNDTYVMSMSDGADRIIEGAGEGAQDRIVLQTGGQALDGLSAQDSHGAGGQGDLVIDYNGQKITVVGHYDGVNAQTGVEFINFEGGSIAGHALGGEDYRISRADGSDNLRTGTTGNDFIAGESAADIINGNEGNDLLFGGGGNDSLNGGAGNDLLVGGEGSNVLSGGTGDDTMMRGVGEGSDRMDGGEGYDTVKVVGDISAEMYAIYTRDEAVLAGITVADDTEIVITRNGTTIAQMQNVEEIVIDGKGGGDSFTTSGDFSGTALSYNTITLQGSEQGDMIDITGLSSAHRIYFRSGGGNDTIIGTLRPQDVIELPKGAKATDYTVVDNEDGTSTLSNGKGHAVTFTRGDGTPQVSDGDGDAEVPDGSGPDVEEPETGDTAGGQPDQGAETPDAQEPDVEAPEDDAEEEEPVAEEPETGDSEEDEPVGEAPDEGAEVEEPESEAPEQGSEEEAPEVDEPETGDGEGETPEDEAPEEDTETEAPESEEPEVEAPEAAEDESEDEDDSAQPPAAAIPPVTPTEHTDYIVGTSDNDTLVGLHGHDAILAGDGADTLSGGQGHDFLSGEAGRDVLFGGGGNDDMLGGDGADMLYGDHGNDRLLAGADDDLVSGGKGDDVVFGGEGNDTFLAEAGDGNDTYYGDDLDGGYGNDTLDMSAITANITANLGTGVGGRGSVVSSQTGRDTLQGVENIVTGSGDDDITASHAVNVIDGGDGDDIFRFLSVGDADGDTIMGFQPGDRIDITGIDANALATGNQSFTLISDGFSGAGELMISEEVREDGTYTILRGNVDEDDEADFEIGIKGSHQINDSHLNL